VANGVDTDKLTPMDPDPEVLERWNLRGKRVLGYLGTFQPYEGLTTLIDAIPHIVARVPEAHVVITGGESEELTSRAEKLGVSQHLTLTGRVPHDQVRGIYSVAEMMAYPRNLTRTTALTTPLKPLEAMAMARPVLVSDVGAMLELVIPNETGLVFRSGDAEHLAEQAVSVLGNPERARSLGKAARAWVEKERQWSKLVARYVDIYGDAISARR
jgi:glycosyltransferase involved in cell wall biosynthesis